MVYYIGLDGGGTKTKCVLTDNNFQSLYECVGGPSNFLLIGTDSVAETLLNLITKTLSNNKLDSSDIGSIVLGTTGAGRRSDANKLEEDFIKYAEGKGYIFNSFRVESDARIALEGAFSGNPGSILISGTGSIMFGKDKSGEIHRVGGFGRFIGDEGSGYSLGRKGLTAVAKEFDGRGPKTYLTNLLNHKFNITEAPQLITEVYKNNFDIASVAPLVIEAAEYGDEICIKIINEEIAELILHIKSMKNLISENSLRLCLIGGTITTDNYYANILKKKISVDLPDVIISEPELPPALGAALMAKNIDNQ